jgi:3-phosphoshikimate 1-carboxyvinyltransferase
MLRGLGVKFSVRGEQITVAGGTIRGGMVESHGDHRIAMAACVAGLASEKGCTVSEGESYAVSYPSFMEDIRSLGGKVRLT